MNARAILAGPGAARALRAGGRGRLEVAMGAGGYVRLGTDGWVLITSPRGPAGPLSLLVAGLGAQRAAAGWAACADGETLVIGPWHIGLAGSRPLPAAGAPPPGPHAEPARIRAALAAALAAAPPPSTLLEPGLSALARGQLSDAVALLAGTGDGLTPAGDDVLAGYAGWRHAAGRPVALSALTHGRSSPIGLAYLRCAERGELPLPVSALLDAVRAGDPGAAARRARALRTWGSSSGAALLWGAAAAAG